MRYEFWDSSALAIGRLHASELIWRNGHRSLLPTTPQRPTAGGGRWHETRTEPFRSLDTLDPGDLASRPGFRPRRQPGSLRTLASLLEPSRRAASGPGPTDRAAAGRGGTAQADPPPA